MIPSAALVLAATVGAGPPAASGVAVDLQPAIAALLAARADAAGGEPARALERLTAALPGAGELAAALRLEAAPLAVGLGRDPWPMLAPLLDRRPVAAHQGAAAAVIRDAAERLSLPLAAGLLHRPLPRPLLREVRAVVAIRRDDTPAAAALLDERDDDRAAREVAGWLAGRPTLTDETRLAVASALLNGGRWREADRLLAGAPSPVAPQHAARLAFLRGRAAYRLGRLEEARGHYSQSLAAAPVGTLRFEAAVQRARTAELLGDLAAARADWDTARRAAPREVEGWDGGARARALLGGNDEAVTLLAQAPTAVRRVAGPRLAALLLARGDHAAARTVLASLPHQAAAVRVVGVAASLAADDEPRARQQATSLLADPTAGAWRALALDLLPGPAAPAEAAVPVRERTALATLAVRAGAPAARAALTAALAADPAWAPLLGDAPAVPAAWSGPAAVLAAAGLWREAATLYPHRFPDATPGDSAWSGHALARAGNGPAALAAGERLWEQLGRPPAILVPDRLLDHIVPSELTAACRRATAAAPVRASWLAAVIRRESRFDPAARSAAGALGLAQFVPETAIAAGVDEAALWDGDTALALAARELARLESRFGPRLEVVAAAYNAGDLVTAMWDGWLGPSVHATLFAAAVPYRETAGYVIAVLEGRSLTRQLEPTLASR
jgi:soluble lytic murein transglycosylase-like protein